jgi:HNH endonuclease
MQDAPYMEIPLRTREGKVRAYTKVSPEDFDRLNAVRWHLTSKGYARRTTTTSGGRQVKVNMARAVLGLDPDDPRMVDHRNRDKLDNRRGNLRIVTEEQNRQNQPQRESSSRFRNVYRHGDKWQATVIHRHLGVYDTEEEAAIAARVGRMLLLPYAED